MQSRLFIAGVCCIGGRKRTPLVTRMSVMPSSRSPSLPWHLMSQPPPRTGMTSMKQHRDLQIGVDMTWFVLKSLVLAGFINSAAETDSWPGLGGRYFTCHPMYACCLAACNWDEKRDRKPLRKDPFCGAAVHFLLGCDLCPGLKTCACHFPILSWWSQLISLLAPNQWAKRLSFDTTAALSLPKNFR